MKKVVQDLTSGGLLGVWGKWVKHAKYIYNIQDFNPEQVLAVGYTKSKFVTDAMMWFDKFSCKRSDLIITVGRDLVETVEGRFKGKKVPKTVMINNWIDENEIYPLESDNERVSAFKKKYGLDGKFVIMYSGNIGLYYDLENLIKVVGKFGAGTKTADGREVVFAFVGAGSVLKTLEDYVAEHHMENVVFIPYQDKADLIYSLNAGDVHWCVNAKGIKGVSCPSKYYGLASAARPVIGVLESGSEIRCLIEDTKGGLCCEPGEYDKVEENIRWFIDNAGSEELKAMGARGRKNLEKNLTRNVSVRKYAEEIKKSSLLLLLISGIGALLCVLGFFLNYEMSNIAAVYVLLMSFSIVVYAGCFTDVQTATARDLFDVASSGILDKFVCNLVN